MPRFNPRSVFYKRAVGETPLPPLDVSGGENALESGAPGTAAPPPIESGVNTLEDPRTDMLSPAGGTWGDNAPTDQGGPPQDLDKVDPKILHQLLAMLQGGGGKALEHVKGNALPYSIGAGAGALGLGGAAALGMHSGSGKKKKEKMTEKESACLMAFNLGVSSAR